MDEILVRLSKAVGIDPDLSRAIAAVESSWNPWAVRYEPKWRYFYFVREYADKLMITVETEQMLQACSWGPMQVMGSVARELGFDAELPRLTNSELGIRYGVSKLKKLFEKYNDESEVISAYNQGSARKTPGGMYENQTYVDKVHKSLNNLRKIT